MEHICLSTFQSEDGDPKHEVTTYKFDYIEFPFPKHVHQDQGVLAKDLPQLKNWATSYSSTPVSFALSDPPDKWSWFTAQTTIPKRPGQCTIWVEMPAVRVYILRILSDNDHHFRQVRRENALRGLYSIMWKWDYVPAASQGAVNPHELFITQWCEAALALQGSLSIARYPFKWEELGNFSPPELEIILTQYFRNFFISVGLREARCNQLFRLQPVWEETGPKHGYFKEYNSEPYSYVVKKNLSGQFEIDTFDTFDTQPILSNLLAK